MFSSNKYPSNSALSVVLIFIIPLYFVMGISKTQFEIILAMSNHFGTKQCVFVKLGDIYGWQLGDKYFFYCYDNLEFEKLSQSSFSSRVLVVEVRTGENQTFANVLNIDHVALRYFSWEILISRYRCLPYFIDLFWTSCQEIQLENYLLFPDLIIYILLDTLRTVFGSVKFFTINLFLNDFIRQTQVYGSGK